MLPRDFFANAMIEQRFKRLDIVEFLASNPTMAPNYKRWLNAWVGVASYLFTEDEKQNLGPVVEPYLPTLYYEDKSHPVARFVDFLWDHTVQVYECGHGKMLAKFEYKDHVLPQYVFLGHSHLLLHPKEFVIAVIMDWAKPRWKEKGALKFLNQRLRQAVDQTREQALRDFDTACAYSPDREMILKADVVIVLMKNGDLLRYDDPSVFYQDKITKPTDYNRYVIFSEAAVDGQPKKIRAGKERMNLLLDLEQGEGRPSKKFFFVEERLVPKPLPEPTSRSKW